MNKESPNAPQSEAERHLPESERRLATLLSNLPGMAYRCKNDRDWTIEYLSDGCEALTGYKAADLVGVGARTYKALIHPDDRDRIWNEVEEALTRRLPFRLTYRIRGADGRERWVWEQGVGVGSGADPEALEGFIIDITVLKDAERKYRDIFEGAIEGMYRISIDGKPLATNPALAKMLGYESPEEVARAVSDTALQIWRDPNERQGFLKLLLDRGVVLGYESLLKRKDGTPVWASINSRVVRDVDGTALYDEGFVEDITERKRAEAALREHDRLLTASQEIAGLGSYALDIVTGTWTSSVVLDNLFGIDAAFTRSVQGWLSLVHPEWRKQMLDHFTNEVIGEHQRFDKEYKIVRHSDGQVRWVHGLGELEFDAHGQPVRMVGTILDVTERKGMEDALRRSEEKFAIAFRSGPSMTLLLKLEEEGNRIIDVNEAFEHVTGYQREEVIGSTTMELGLWADPGELEAATKQLRVNGSLRNMEYHFRRKTGDIRTGLLSTESIEMDGKQCAISTTIDITEQKQAQAAIQQAHEAVAKAEAHYRLMFNSVSDAVFVHKFGEDGLPSPFFEVNDNACRLLGYTRGELLQMRVVDIIAPEENFDAPANAKRLLADGHRNWEGLLSLKDGRRIPVEVNARVFDLDGSPTIISSIRDISERKEAEEQYRNIFDGALEGIYRTSPEGNLLAANSALAKMLGYESREQLVSTINDMAHQVWLDPNDRRRFIALLEEQGSLRNFECQVKRKDGLGILVSVKGRKVCGADGRTLYYDGFVDDITERKHTEAEKVKLEEQLRQAQKIESIGRLAGGVAHDFNNLLTVINGYSDFLLERLAPSDPLRSHAEEIRKAGERAAGLTKQLLAFSRRQTIEPRIVDLNTTIRESAPMLQRLIGEDIALRTHLDSSLGQIMADPDQIHQVLMNFAVNARDAMAVGGTLAIETTSVELDEATCATISLAATPGHYVLMSVTDTGNGMDETTRQHIFEPFFTTKKIGKGTGLGLATVYGIIRQGGGWIEVQSEVGVGTSFKVYLPRIDAFLPPEEHEISAANGKGSETILLVEDQEAVRSFGVAALKRYGYSVIEAADGEEAIAAAGKYSGELHLLLTDVVLPGMNGKELSEILKAFRPNLKVLFTSGYTADVIGNRGVLGPDVTLLHKPFTQQELAQKVREVLEGL